LFLVYLLYNNKKGTDADTKFSLRGQKRGGSMTEVPMTEVPVLEEDRCHPVIKLLMSLVGGIFSGYKPVVKKDVVPSEENVVSPVIKEDITPPEQVVIVPPKMLTRAERAKVIRKSAERTEEAMSEIEDPFEQLKWLDENALIDGLKKRG